MTVQELACKLPSYKRVAKTIVKIMDGNEEFKQNTYYKHTKQNFWWYVNGFRQLHVVKAVPETNSIGTSGYAMTDFLIHPNGQVQNMRTFGWECTKEKCLKTFQDTFGHAYDQKPKSKERKKGGKNGKIA